MINSLKNKRPEYLPYSTPEFNCKYKLDANESPWDLPTSLRVTLAHEVLTGCNLHRYPDPNSLALKEALAKYHGLEVDNFVAGSGSDELIHMLVSAFIDKGDNVVMPTPTFGMYKIYTSLVGGIPIEIPLKDDYSYDIPALIDSINQFKPKLMIICNPNNPTGNTIDLTQLKTLSQNFQGLVVIDEAYGEFTQRSAIPLLTDCANLLILKTFSKAFGLAGLRVGYSISNPEIAAALNRVKSPYNLNSFSQRAATLILEDYSSVKTRIKKILKQRDFMYTTLSKIPSLCVYPSEANFLLIRIANSNSIWHRLQEKGILVRNFGDHPFLQDCLRVTIADKKTNIIFMETLLEILKEEGRELPCELELRKG